MYLIYELLQKEVIDELYLMLILGHDNNRLFKMVQDISLLALMLHLVEHVLEQLWVYALERSVEYEPHDAYEWVDHDVVHY